MSKSRGLGAAADGDEVHSGRIPTSIARRIGRSILSGDIQPGEVLSNEVDASEQLKVSRSAYREAMRMLSAKGLVESRPKTGTRVNTRRRWSLLDPDVLSWLFTSEPGEAFVRELYELRMIVEPAAAALAARRRDDAQLERMRTALVTMQHETLTTETGRSADRDFHNAVFEAARNAPLLTLSSGIGAAVRWTTIFKQRNGRLPRDPMPEHWKVFDAIAAQRPDDARANMEALVSLALAATRASLDLEV